RFGLERAGAVLGDGKLLTLWGAIASLATFLVISRISIRGLPTWWSSIVAALALVAAFPAITAGPASVTLLGLAILLWLFHRSVSANSAPATVPVAALFVVWSNLDPLAWFGLAVLWAAAVGRMITSGDRRGATAGTQTSWLKVAVIATVAAAIHPFHWHVLEAPVVFFGTEIPEARSYGLVGPHFRWMLYSVNDPVYWRNLDWPVVSGAVLTVVTLVTLILNAGKASLSHVAVFIVANALAFRAGLLLPAASVVNAVLAGLNGQAWYARTFRQTYSIAVTELLFSRIGRAVTVLGLFGLAYLMINGALPGVDGRRLGMGFDWRIRTATESYAALATQTDDNRGFNGRPDHGDLMIWAGLRPFNDSRLALYARGGEDLLQLHRATFRALQPAQKDAPETGKPEVWKANFERFQIKHVYARLTGDDALAKYSLLSRLLQNPELKLTAIDAAAARLDPVGAGEPATAPLPRLGFDPIAQVFRGEEQPLGDIPAWPRELTTYERWLIQPEPIVPRPGQLAQHLSFLGDTVATSWPADSKPGETSHALRIEAIQNAWKSLRTDPNSPQVHRVLRRIYRQILGGEQGFGQFGSLNELRVRQLLAAEYVSVVTADPQPADHEQLAYALASIGYRDVALEHLQTVYKKTGQWTSLPTNDPNFDQAKAENQALLKELETAVKEVQTNANRELQRGEDPFAVAKAAFDAGCPRFALTIMEPHEAQLVRDPMAGILHAQVLMAVGRIEEGWERLEGLEVLFPPGDAQAPGAADLRSIWRSNTAIANMVRGNVERAVELWREEARFLETQSARSALDNVPLSTTIPTRHDLLGYVGARIGADVLYTFPERWASIQMLLTVSQIEHGQIEEARKAVTAILTRTPTASIRPLALYYHSILTGQPAPQLEKPDESQENQLFDDQGGKVDPSSAAGSPPTGDSPPPPPVAVPLN
ncbi:MAG TPA: hypothetical protein VM452_11185, partial [Caulifigura sp.]|nr:hypothetical protein [Caulifigura sp.]